MASLDWKRPGQGLLLGLNLITVDTLSRLDTGGSGVDAGEVLGELSAIGCKASGQSLRTSPGDVTLGARFSLEGNWAALDITQLALVPVSRQIAADRQFTLGTSAELSAPVANAILSAVVDFKVEIPTGNTDYSITARVASFATPSVDILSASIAMTAQSRSIKDPVYGILSSSVSYFPELRFDLFLEEAVSLSFALSRTIHGKGVLAEDSVELSASRLFSN